MKFKFMMGVLEGYGHDNKGLTEEKTIALGTEAIRENIPAEIEVDSISLASAIYPEAFGAPKGGEMGVLVEGEIREEEQEIFYEGLKKAMQRLGQNTVTVEFSEGDKSLGSAYVSEKGEKVERFETSKESVESLRVRIPDEFLENGLGSSLQRVGSQIQDKLQSEREGAYLITGVLTERKDEYGKYYEYTATQNPVYGQTSRDEYMDSTVEMFKKFSTHLRDSIMSEFNSQTVVIEPNSMDIDERDRDYIGDDIDIKVTEGQITLDSIKLALQEKENER